MTRRWLVQLFIAAIFLGLALLSLQLGVYPFLSRPLWLPAALVAALVFARGTNDQWGLALGAALFGFWRYPESAFRFEVMAVNALAVFAQVHVASYLLQRWLSPQGRELWRGRDLGVAALVLGPMMSLKPLLVLPVLLARGLIQGSNLADLALDWILIDAMAAFLVAPIFLVLVGQPRVWWRSRRAALLVGQTAVVVCFVVALHSSALVGGDRVHALLDVELGNRIERLQGKLDQLEEYGVPPEGGSRALSLVRIRIAEMPTDPMLVALPNVPGWALNLVPWSMEERATFASRGWQFLLRKEGATSDTLVLPNEQVALTVEQPLLIGANRYRASLVLTPVAVRALISRSLWWFQLTFSVAALLATLVVMMSSGRRRMLEQLVSERTASLQEASKELVLFKALADQATDPIVVAQPQLGTQGVPILSYVNPAFTRVTQYQLSDLLNLADLRGSETDRAKISNLFKLLGSGVSAKAEFFQYRKNGERYLAQLNAFPIFSESHSSNPGQDTVTHWAGLYRDISEERARERFSQERERHEQVGRMAGGVAHDFNNLLTAIQGSVELIRMEAQEHEVAPDLLETIEHAVRSGSELTQQLLAFSGRGQGRIETIDLSERVRAMHKMLKMTVTSNALLVVKVAPGSHLVQIDPAWLSQILVNLVINGAQALEGKPGSVTVEVLPAAEFSPPSPLLAVDESNTAPLDFDQTMVGVVSEQAKPGPHICISVRDTGCGIAPDRVHKIFEPFYTTKAEGTGLGLAAVAGVVRDSRAWLTLKSMATHLGTSGTEFRVYLPAFQNAEGAVVSSSPEATSAQSRNVRLQKSLQDQLLLKQSGANSVLVVDDEPGVRGFMQAVLVAYGWEVSVAQDGAAAQSLLEAQRFDLVITDLTMPKMSGFELVEWMALQAHCPPIIVMSGYSVDREVLMQRHCARIKAWLDKPFTVVVLLNALSEATASSLIA